MTIYVQTVNSQNNYDWPKIKLIKHHIYKYIFIMAFNLWLCINVSNLGMRYSEKQWGSLNNNTGVNNSHMSWHEVVSQAMKV